MTFLGGDQNILWPSYIFSGGHDPNPQDLRPWDNPQRGDPGSVGRSTPLKFSRPPAFPALSGRGTLKPSRTWRVGRKMPRGGSENCFTARFSKYIGLHVHHLSAQYPRVPCKFVRGAKSLWVVVMRQLYLQMFLDNLRLLA